MAILEVKDVSFAYAPGRPVLDGVSMCFDQGKVYTIFGPSGCGKTTLLSLMGALDAPTGGQVLFDGQDIAKTGYEKHRRDHVAFVFQNYNLIEYMTSIENVNLTSQKPAMPFLEQVGLTQDEAKRNVLKLSGGQQQRVAIARALASDAPVILADEPTGNLDEDTAAEITQLLCRVAHEYNKCVIIVSHSAAVADASDVVFRLSHGKLETVEEETQKTDAD